MARTGTAVARIVLALLLAHGAAAAVIQQDNSAVCVSVMPACEAKCKGQQYFFICAAGNGPMGTPYIICRCAQPAPAVGGPQQSERARRPGRGSVWSCDGLQGSLPTWLWQQPPVPAGLVVPQ
jgi:hypothetical protein